MVLRIVALRGALALAAAAGALLLSACTYERDGPPTLHFQHFQTTAPRNDTVTVCSAYGCQHQTPFTFTGSDIRQLAAIMEESRVEETPGAERAAIGKAIAWLERRVGAVTGTDRDRPGLDLLGSGDRAQQDCVDEATNTTSYLLVMERHGLLRHHVVARPIAKGNLILGQWPHWGAMIREKASGRRYAVDSFFGANGERPLILAAQDWYMKDDGVVLKLPPPDAVADARPPSLRARQRADRGGLNRLFDRVLAEEPGPRPSVFGYR